MTGGKKTGSDKNKWSHKIKNKSMQQRQTAHGKRGCVRGVTKTNNETNKERRKQRGKGTAATAVCPQARPKRELLGGRRVGCT
jgi:hypothetical protein